MTTTNLNATGSPVSDPVTFNVLPTLAPVSSKEYTERVSVVKFLFHLHRGGQWAYLWTDAGKRSFWYPVGKPAPLPKEKINIYFGVHPTASKRNGKQRSRIEDVTAINCLFAEFDAKDFKDDKAQALDHIQRLPLAPSVLVDSGGGYHCYWLLRETFIIDSSADRKRARESQAQWVIFTGGDQGAKDLARVLRFPGTRNYKKHYAPNFPEVKFIESNFDRLYTLDELDRVMQPASATPQPLPKRNESQRKTKYAQVAYESELAKLGSAQPGARDDTLNKVSFRVGQMITGWGIDRGQAERDLYDAVIAKADESFTEKKITYTISRSINEGMREPAKLPANGNGRVHPPKNGNGASLPNDAEGQGDPIMALIESAAQNKDRDVALQNVFDAIAFLDHIKIVTTYKPRVQDSFNLPAKDFDLILNNTRRKTRSLAEVIDGQLCWNRNELCSFNPRITHELSQQDGQSAARVLYTIEGNLANGEPLRPLTIPADELENLQWINQWGARAIILAPPRERYLLPRAMKELSQAKRETVYTFTGWNDKSFFTASGAITPEGLDPSVRVDLGEGQMQKYSLPEPPRDPVDVMRASLDFLELAPLTVTAPLWAAMYAAPLTSRYSLNAVMWVHGKTQSRKSTITALALTHFGKGFINGRDPKPPKDWESTYTDLEGAMFATKDLPLVIDDYTPQQTRSDSDSQRVKAQRIIKSVGNRSSRDRANANLTERPSRPPRGLVISTAEEMIIGQAINGRMIYIQVNANDVKTGAPLDQAQRLAGAGAYSQAMAAYLQWFARDENKRLTQAINNDHETAIREGNEKLPSAQSRLISYYAALYTGARNGLRFALESKAIHHVEFDFQLKRIAGALLELLITQGKRTASQSPIIRLCLALADVITQGNATILKRLQPKSSEPTRVSLLGWYNEIEPIIYLHTATCLQVARDYYNRLGENFDVSGDSLRRDMANCGLLAKRDDGQYETNDVFMGVGYGQPRVLTINADALEAYTGVNLYPRESNEEKK